jgi:hypothetical protein
VTAALFVSAADVTAIYGIPRSLVIRWIHRRRADGRPVSPVPFSRLARGAVVFERAALESYIARQAVGGQVRTLRRATR